MTMMRIMTGALFGASASAALAADGTDTLNQSVWLRVGAFHPAISSNAQIDHPQTGVAGTAIEFERDLGLGKKKTLPTLLLGARFAGAWRAEFEYFHLGRTGAVVLQAFRHDPQVDAQHHVGHGPFALHEVAQPLWNR